MKKGIVFFLFIIGSLMIGSCKKDKDSSPDKTPISDIVKEQNEKLAKVITTSTVKAFVQGYVLDENEQAIANAEITHGDKKVKTDANGYFVLEELSLNKELAVIYAEKQGYFRGIRTFTPTQESANTITFVLQKKGTAQTLKASEGGRLSFNGNVILDFPKGSISDENGQVYDKEVKVYTRYIDPRKEYFASAMPGNLVGLGTNNELAGMISYGMAGVELTDVSGRPLQVTSGKSVTVTMPAILDAPDQMPIWHFNEQYGVWVQTGEVQKNGNSYSFEANHFSTWNLDLFVEDNVGFSTIQVVNSNGDKIANQRVDIYTADFSNRLRVVTTDYNGEFNLMYAPQEIGVKVVFECEDIAKTITLTNNGKSTIVVNNGTRAKTYLLKGVVKDCEAKIYPDAYFSFQGLINKKISFSGKTDASGKYSVSLALCDITNGQSEFIIATVYTGINTIKKDTFNLLFNGQVLSNDINFCETDEQEFTNPYLNPNLTYGSITDIDGYKYATIQIGNQTWMAENLRTTKYNDGTPIPHITDSTQWVSDQNGAYCMYENSTVNEAIYGKLYNWYAVNTGKLCPKGWHIPTDAEWEQLRDYLGSNAGGKLKATGNTTDGAGLWSSPNSGATNESGFSGLPGGYRGYNGPYYNLGYAGYWWSSTEYSTDNAWSRYLFYSYGFVYRSNSLKTNGFSCRCARD